MKDLFTIEEIEKIFNDLTNEKIGIGCEAVADVRNWLMAELTKEPFKPEAGKVYMAKSSPDYPYLMTSGELYPTQLREMNLSELSSSVRAYVEGVKRFAEPVVFKGMESAVRSNELELKAELRGVKALAAQILKDNPIEDI